MSKKSSNLAIVSDNTFESALANNLSNYDISSILQTTLDFNKLIEIFSSKIKHLVPHTAYSYSHPEFDLEIRSGVFSRHSCRYALIIEKQKLGELTLMRNAKFEEDELKLLETLLCCLIYPLKNATLYQQAIQLAYTDPLTKANNRASFNDSVKREICHANRTGKALSLIFLDIDHFKAINDSYGHDGGDFTLASIAKQIKDNLRGSDMLFRTGGEEFVILLRDTPISGAEQLAERIRLSVEHHVLTYAMGTINVTLSLGVSSWQKIESTEMFIKRADEALYQAKRSGRNRVVLAKT
jgi:diguanylate cyclase (GGDEF)-like protein